MAENQEQVNQEQYQNQYHQPQYQQASNIQQASSYYQPQYYQQTASYGHQQQVYNQNQYQNQYQTYIRQSPQTVRVVEGEAQQIGTQIQEGVVGNRQLVSTTVTNYQQPAQSQTIVQQVQQPVYQVYESQPIQYQQQVQTQEIPQARTEFLGTTTQQQGHIKGESRIEYVPYETSHIDYQAVQKVETIPHEKRFTDYYTVEHQTEYIPHVYTDKFIDYIPQEKAYYEYAAQERQQQRVEYQAVTKQIVHGGQTATNTFAQKPQDTVESRIIGQSGIYTISQPQILQTVQQSQFVQQPQVFQSNIVQQLPVTQSTVVQQPIQVPVQQSQVVYQPVQYTQFVQQPQVQQVSYVQQVPQIYVQQPVVQQPVQTLVQPPIQYQKLPVQNRQVQVENRVDAQQSVQSQQNQQGILEKILQ